MGRDKRPPRAALRVVKGASAVIQALMDAQGVTKAELARRVGKSRAYVTQSLSGERNMTLSTFAGLADALDADVVLAAQPRGRTEGRLIPKRSNTAPTTPEKGDDDDARTQRRTESRPGKPR